MAMELPEVAVIVVGLAGLPTAEHDALPLEGQGADGGVPGGSARLEQSAVGLGPAAGAQGTTGVLMKGLPQVQRAGVAFFDQTVLPLWIWTTNATRVQRGRRW